MRVKIGVAKPLEKLPARRRRKRRDTGFALGSHIFAIQPMINSRVLSLHNFRMLVEALFCKNCRVNVNTILLCLVGRRNVCFVVHHISIQSKLGR